MELKAAPEIESLISGAAYILFVSTPLIQAESLYAEAPSLMRARLMTTRWIWLVPSKICMTLASRM